MKKMLRWITCTVAIALAVAMGVAVIPDRESNPGSADVLRAAYEFWRAERESRGAHDLNLALGWSKGLSNEFTRAHGSANFNVERGEVSIEIEGLPDPGSFDVWLVDNVPGPGRSVKPEVGDEMVFVGSVRSQPGPIRLQGQIDRDRLRGFELDLIVVSRSGLDPGESGLLYGAPSLFERLDAQARRRGESASSRDPILPAFLRTFAPGTAHAAAPDVDFEALVDEGAALFFGETFAGNGRTCGTCHPASNNFTLDPQFIATLPPNHPLFVAETNPDLAQNFEKPELMRQLGLILENVDGFDDLANKFVMRGVPPTLALPTQLQAPRIAPPLDRTGWGGDGAPGAGRLRDFAIGAVTQHFTRTLNRTPKVDFRLPSDEELNALEAFQRSLGRQKDLDLPLKLKAKGPADGQAIFRRIISIFGAPAGKCNACHGDAGARDSVVGLGIFVINFNTGVENIPNQPADLIDPTNPPDGGFGTKPDRGVFGNGTFSTPPVVESADTPPFFHNNAVATIEDAVRFYSTPAFNNSPGGRLVGGIKLKDAESLAVAAFLRVINALENIRQAEAYQTRQQKVGLDEARNLRLAAAELGDATEVLSAVGLHLEDAVPLLIDAQAATEAAAAEADPEARKVLVAKAIASQVLARAAMVEPQRR